MNGSSVAQHRPHAFTLVELLVVIAVVALLIGVMLPALSGARHAAHQARCLSQTRQLGMAWDLYAVDNTGLAMPATTNLGSGRRVYWWGAENLDENRVDHTLGPLAAGLGQASLGEGSVFECPAQPLGSYTPQGQIEGQPTSTYGYNAYGLCPPSAGYDAIKNQRWLRLAQIKRPDSLAVFADAMIELGPTLKNSALLDPPKLFDRRGRWRVNRSPTTSFRHRGKGVVAAADGHAASHEPWTAVTGNGLGSLSEGVGPWYVPDAENWAAGHH